VQRLRFGAVLGGCLLLFWQQDAAPVDWLFGLAIVASALTWRRGSPEFDLAWPQPLLLVFLAAAAAASTLAGGVPRALATEVYLILASLAIASTLRDRPTRVVLIERTIVAAATIAAVLVTLGALAGELGIAALQQFAYDDLRGMGLFKDPNVAGTFIACSYPLAVAVSRQVHRWRAPFLIILTGVLATGVVFSYSRLALGVLVLSVVATSAALLATRQRRLSAALIGLMAAAGAGIFAAVSVDAVPAHRYRPVQGYDESGRFVTWGVGLQLFREAPLGTGAGSFEDRMRYWFELKEHPNASDPPENLAANGAFDGQGGWRLRSVTGIVDDPASLTGRALLKRSTEPFQDAWQRLRVEPGLTYSVAAQIRTDGTQGLVIVHWRDEKNVTIAQFGTRIVSSPEWTESQALAQVAPSEAVRAIVFLSNLEPGEQRFTAVRFVRGPTVPEWSPDMQVPTERLRAEDEPATLSAHNTYLRAAVETGIVGAVALLAYWSILLVVAWRNVTRTNWHWAMAFTLVMLGGFLIDTLHWRQVWIYAAVLAAGWSRPPVVVQATGRRIPERRRHRVLTQ